MLPVHYRKTDMNAFGMIAFKDKLSRLDIILEY
jgi:hypothetical protein